MRFLKDYIAVMENKESLIELESQIKTFFKESNEIQKTTYMQVVSDGPDQLTDNMKAAYIKMLMIAEKSIYIQTPYFIVDREFFNALKTASLSGVDVSVMIPVVPDNHFVHRTTTSYIKELLGVGIEVQYYQGFLHSKTMIIDETISAIWSVNMDVRSFSINFEISAFIYDREFTKTLIKQFNKDKENCIKLDETYEQNKSTFQKAEESVYRLLSMLI